MNIEQLLKDYKKILSELEHEWQKPKKENGGSRDEKRIDFLRLRKVELKNEIKSLGVTI